MAVHNSTLPHGERYEFRVRGLLQPDWSDWLEGLVIIPLENGDSLLSGFLTDQAALHGVLAKIRDLNLLLVSMKRLNDT